MTASSPRTCRPMMELASVAPFRDSVRPTATAAYEHEEEAAPNAVAIITSPGRSLPSIREIVCLDTSASTMAER